MIPYQHIGFLGVGGIGVSALAQMSLDANIRVSGLDCMDSELIQKLRDQGANIEIHERLEALEVCDVWVYSTAVQSNEVFFEEISGLSVQLNIPLLHRSEFLDFFVKAHAYSIAVTGTHGKSTTTAIIVYLLMRLGQSSNFFVGGHLHDLSRKYAQFDIQNVEGVFVTEADESDASFMNLSAKDWIVTNLDDDHLTHYDGDPLNLLASISEVLRRKNACEHSHMQVLNADDPLLSVWRLSSSDSEVNLASMVLFGQSKMAQYCFSNVRFEDEWMYFDLKSSEGVQVVKTRLLGEYQAYNIVAAMAYLNAKFFIDLSVLSQLISEFTGVERRMQRWTDSWISGVRLLTYDDYGHHPTEIISVISMLRACYPKRRIVHIFQPHRYSRTLTLKEDFRKVLVLADDVLLLPVYSAGEAFITGSESVDLIVPNSRMRLVEDAVEVLEVLKDICVHGQDQEIIVCIQGAGDISNKISKLLPVLSALEIQR